jgi:hypothetical protein
MSEQHVTSDMLHRLQRRELQGSELIATLRHLGTCHDCSNAASAGLRFDPAAFDYEAVDEHLDPETQIIPCVDGGLSISDREMVETHLEDCDFCRRETNDLQMLRARHARPRPRRSTAIAAAIAASVVVALLAFFTRSDRVARTAGPRTAIRPIPVQPAQNASTPRTTPAHTYTNAEWTRAVATAIAAKRLPFPRDLAELTSSGDVLRGASSSGGKVLHPVGVVIDKTRPRFAWDAAEDASFVVSVYADDEEVARSAPLQTTHWTPSRALPRGKTYEWQVAIRRGDTTTLLPGPSEPHALFRITSEEEHHQLAAARREYPDDRLLHAVLAARAGLVHEARAALEAAIQNGDADAAAIAPALQDPTSTNADQ